MASKRQLRALGRKILQQGDTDENYTAAAMEFDDMIARIVARHADAPPDNCWEGMTSEEIQTHLAEQLAVLLAHSAPKSKEPKPPLLDWIF